MPFDLLPQIFISWNQSTEPLTSFLRYQVYRRVAGETTWVAMKDGAITDRSRSSYQDASVMSDVLYEYAVTQWSDSSGEEIESNFPTEVQGQLTIYDVFIHDVLAPSNYVQMMVDSQVLETHQDIVFLQTWNRQSPTAHIGNKQTRRVSIPMRGVWGYDEEEIYRGIINLITRQRTLSSRFLVRQRNDVHVEGVIMSPFVRSDRMTNFDQTLVVQEVE